MTTRAATRMEEQMAALLEKMDQQNEQLQLLTRQQAERVDGIALKQKETDENLDAIQGRLGLRERDHGWTNECDGRVHSRPEKFPCRDW